MSARIENCRSCGAKVIFALTDPKGGQEPSVAPFDAETSPDGNLILVYRKVRWETRLVAITWEAGQHDPLRRRKSHFATCPQANDWRKKQMVLEFP